MRQVGERGRGRSRRGSRPGARRSPGLWLWCSGAAPGEGARGSPGKGGRLLPGAGSGGVAPAAVASPEGGCCHFPPALGAAASWGGVRLDREEPRGGSGPGPAAFSGAGARGKRRRSGGRAGGRRGGAAAPGQGTQALKDVGKTETGGSWGSGGGHPAAGASLLPGRVGWLRSRSFLRKKRRRKQINK